MFCPQCKAEYREGFTMCSDCDKPLVWSLPPRPDKPEVVALPPMGPSDLPVVQSLLEGAGIPFFVANESGFKARPTIVIRATDKPDVKELLKDLEVEVVLGVRGPLQW